MAYRTGVSTSRGLSSLADHVGVSPVPLFDRVLRGGAALEIGCGEGRALLELQQRHPATRCVCLNYAGWKGGWGQGVGGGAQASADAATLRGMGAHYGLSLAADARLPDVRYGDWHNLTGFDDDSAYSLVYSQNALNEGKMHYPRRELAPLLTSVARMRLVRFGYRDAVAPAAPPPSPAGCGGGAVESPLARRIKRLFKKKRGRGAKAAEPPKPPSCREQLARKKASKRAQQEAGEGPVFRQAYLDAVGAWMDAATG